MYRPAVGRPAPWSAPAPPGSAARRMPVQRRQGSIATSFPRGPLFVLLLWETNGLPPAAKAVHSRFGMSTSATKRTAFVTGASYGVGAATALALAREGYDV